jgi:hypothetical protein
LTALSTHQKDAVDLPEAKIETLTVEAIPALPVEEPEKEAQSRFVFL